MDSVRRMRKPAGGMQAGMRETVRKTAGSIFPERKEYPPGEGVGEMLADFARRGRNRKQTETAETACREKKQK